MPVLAPAPVEAPAAPLATVCGEPLLVLPKDLYIPPDALEVFLETFEGPLDVLLYLIKRQNLDILNIPIAEITRQYMEYIALMSELRLELAAEYLVMAAMLAEIKSRMLLPRQSDSPDEEDDPRAELVRRLLEYERFKKAAQDLDTLPRLERDVYLASAQPPPLQQIKRYPEVALADVLLAFQDVLQRAAMYRHHHIEREPLSVRERMSQILALLEHAPGFIPFVQLFTLEEGRGGVVVSFLAVLELVKGQLIALVQPQPFAPIYIGLNLHSAPACASARPHVSTDSVD